MSTVDPYTGQSQQQSITQPLTIQYQSWDGEEGSWSMPPYSGIFDYSSQSGAGVPPPPPPSDAPYKPQPWITQIKLPYVPPVPGRISGRTAFDQVVIQIGSVIPPYAQTFGFNSQADAETQAWVPPPVSQTDIFLAQQTWPL